MLHSLRLFVCLLSQNWNSDEIWWKKLFGGDPEFFFPIIQFFFASVFSHELLHLLKGGKIRHNPMIVCHCVCFDADPDAD